MSKIRNLTELDFNTTLQNVSTPVLVDFSATWCGPCKALNPILEKLSDELADKALICKVDIDESPEIAQRYGIRGVPTLVSFRDGKETNRSVGLVSKEKLLKLIE